MTTTTRGGLTAHQLKMIHALRSISSGVEDADRAFQSMPECHCPTSRRHGRCSHSDAKNEAVSMLDRLRNLVLTDLERAERRAIKLTGRIAP